MELLNTTPLDNKPAIELLSRKNFYDYTIDDFKISGISGIKRLTNILELAI
jgi:hypothetical protein